GAVVQGRPYLYFISLVATIGGLMFGFDVGIISGAIPFIQPYFNWDELQLGWGVSSILVGCIVGAFGTGALTEKYGRKSLLITVALFFAVSCAGMALAKTVPFFISFRVLGGLAVGAVSVLSPMYVAEVAPSKIRGTLVTIYQLAITMGILISYLVNFALHDVDNNWRWMFATGLIPSVIFFVGLIFIPESPRWLVKAGQKVKAKVVLERIGGSEFAGTEIGEIEKSLVDTRGTGSLKLLFSPRFRRVIGLGLLLSVFVQITGINTVVDYAPKILMTAGLEIRNALLQTSLIGLVNFVFTFFAVWLIDRLGRRTFYLIGSSGMAVTLLMIAASFHFELNPIFTTVCIMMFIAFFASCIGPAFWTLVSEMFPNQIRGQAVALASFTQWVFNFLVVLLFPYVLEAFGGSLTFLFLAVMSVIQLMIAWFFIKETKGKTLEEIEDLWKK
ncbi:MAG: sugar porter family MFS transporter, partial [Bacteroidales bacterium]|nr:sugar porter family MFS transporter [Bacteroidales bacterium]